MLEIGANILQIPDHANWFTIIQVQHNSLILNHLTLHGQDKLSTR